MILIGCYQHSPIDYECRSCFHERKVEENIYVCKSKQKCEHWRNHYYICDQCSIRLRKSDKFKAERARIVDRLQGALQFVTDEFNQSMRDKYGQKGVMSSVSTSGVTSPSSSTVVTSTNCSSASSSASTSTTVTPSAQSPGTTVGRSESQSQSPSESERFMTERAKQLEIFNTFTHRTDSFELNFLNQMKDHITTSQFEETKARFRGLRSHILKVSSSFIDEKYRGKFECNLLIFGFIRELYDSMELESRTPIFNAVPDYVFHVCLDYFFQIHPQIFIISMAKGRLRSRHFDNIEILDLNDGVSSDLHFYDMKSFNKSFHSYHRHTVHGYHHRRGSSATNSKSSLTNLSALTRSPLTGPFVHHTTSLSIQSTEDELDSMTMWEDRLSAAPSPLLQSQSSPSMHPTSSISQRMGHITSTATPTTIVKQKSWNRKDCGFCVAQSVPIPQFIVAIKPSLFEHQHHYDVVFKSGGERMTGNGPKQWSSEATALIIDSHPFDHHYSDRYAFKFRHIRLQSHLKLQQFAKQSGTKRKRNGYSLSLPPLPRKRRAQCLFDDSRKQLLLYCDADSSFYSLAFNDSLKSENEWKWEQFEAKMKWPRTRPSIALCGRSNEYLIVIGDADGNNAHFVERYSFEDREWMEMTLCPWVVDNGLLFNDSMNNRVYLIGGPQRICGYLDVAQNKWIEIASTQYVYSKSNSVIWNSVERGSLILWIANTAHCECLRVDGDDDDDNGNGRVLDKAEWQTFPNLQDNDTHFKIQNYLNVRADTANCDYTLIARV